MYRQQIMDNQINHLDRLNNYQSNQTPSNTGSQICCLIDEGTRCHRLSGNACCSKPIQRKMMIQRTKLRLSIDETARHIYICDHHKNIIQTMRSINKRKKKDDDDDSIDEYSFNNNMNYDLDDLPVVDLSNLQVNTLRRYKRHYRVSTKPGINKSQLVECIENHFHNIPVVEREVLTYFIYMVKTNKNKLDQKSSNQV